MSPPHLSLEHEITEVTRQLAGVEAQLATAIETYLDHQSQAGRHDSSSIELGGVCSSSSFVTSNQRPRQETEPNLLRPSKSNVAIIKIEPESRPSSRRRKSHCSSKVTLNTLHQASLSSPDQTNNIQTQRKSEINPSQSVSGYRRNSRSQSVRVSCSQGTQIKIINKNCEEPENSKSQTNNGLESDISEKIIRRSRSVVIHCNSRDTNRPHGKTNPVICDTKHDALDDQHDDCLGIKENLDDIKLEIERLIHEREQFFQENSVLKFYKRAYQHLQLENSQLREKISKLEDRSEEDGRGDGGEDLLDRSSPDGQDMTDRHPAEINRLESPDVRECTAAVRELIILNSTLEHLGGESADSLQQYLNDTNGECNKSKEGIYNPENLEDLYQDITKNVVKKIVKIRNLKNAIVKV